jgi:hypothetical protein
MFNFSTWSLNELLEWGFVDVIKNKYILSTFRTGKESRLVYFSIILKSYLPVKSRVYYCYLASLIPVTMRTKWIPKDLVDEKVAKPLIPKFLTPENNGYRLKQEEKSL